uniref:HMG box domain-containing protein n=1 Tax=Astatotilapia calliptera TaxID=8154 RepID=A0AAX7UVU8_ASTCA
MMRHRRSTGTVYRCMIMSLLLLHLTPPLQTKFALLLWFTDLKRKCPAQQDEDGPYVKKPPNAFMLYLKEQRPKVIAELNIPGSAAVNAVVGQRWKSLSNDQKARYFKQAETERQNHAKEHPAWSTKENYGKKRKRIRLRKESASVHEEVVQQANNLRMRPAESQPSSSSHSFLTEPHEQPQTKP